MKKVRLSIVLLCLSLWCSAQDKQLVFGRVDTVYSQVLNEKRPVFIYSPGYDTTYFTKPQYPVLYVLDGDAYFASLVTMIQQLSAINGNTVLPEMIIVGIPNLQGKRNRDLTPTPDISLPGSGGGEMFTSFLEHELIPYIDRHYATAPYRTLVGHSLGGLMAVNILLKHPGLFSSYVALDPSMFYARRNLLRQVKKLLHEQELSGKTLFLGIANTMNPGMDTVRVRSDTSEITDHIRSILQLKDELKVNNTIHLRWDYKYYPDDDHASMVLIAEYDALRFIFQHNRFPRNQPQNQYFDKSYSAGRLKMLINAHYEQASKEMGYQVRPTEFSFNQLGYVFLQQKNYDKAALFFQLNIQFYPGSFNVYDSMGDYYLTTGKKGLAIAYFEKALKLKDTDEIRNKLLQLKM
jgi:predicted alpha/beta superfamily hydrolase